MPLWLRHQGYFENYGGVYNGVRNMLKKRLKAISQERLRNEFGEQNPK